MIKKNSTYKIKTPLDEKVLNIINIVLLAIFSCMFLYPVLYVFSAAISNPYLVENGSVFLFPKGLNLNSLIAATKMDLFWRSYINAIYITGLGTVVNMLFTVTGAYALSKPELKFRKFWVVMVVVTMWFDPGMIPRYLNFRDFGLINSYTGVIVGFAVNTFNVIILKSFFESVPKSFEESARIDGANQFQVLLKIYIPLSMSAINTVTLFYAASRWNGYFWTLLLLTDEDKAPLQVFLKKLIVDRATVSEATQIITPDALTSPTTIIYAVIVMSLLPMLIAYPFVQRFFKKGVNIGGVKE